MRYDTPTPDWHGRDRFLLSTGHYSIAMYAALAEAGYLTHEELPTYGLNGSRLPAADIDLRRHSRGRDRRRLARPPARPGRRHGDRAAARRLRRPRLQRAVRWRTAGGLVPTLMARERAHFVRVANDEWDTLIAELETTHG
ncbi:hypothetical protein [Lichenifustis flavocetrariae]|uniref:Transketolase N-terminal domain-containing protein n=1 Tax=Lichenifustis flavocetrariae TaxID=2949735 RepID=A0AA42CHY4_9HYPH|nr:hypothetical protein [Lichenifustis flavocetrariae]MCW6507774.1 hypothetical protein [Lichenifustis flavocetrariae]